MTLARATREHHHRCAATVGETLLLDLEERASAGYLWEVETTAPAGVRAAGEEWQAGSGSGFGGFGRHHPRFLLATAGEWTLVLVHRRPWTTDAPLERLTVALAAAPRGAATVAAATAEHVVRIGG